MFRAVVMMMLLVVGWSTFVFAQDMTSATRGYLAKTGYDGLYKSERLYRFDPLKETWFANQQHKLWEKLACHEARSALAETGEWVGNLTDGGACAGKNEAPRWASGNYLNFFNTVNASGPGSE